MLCFLVLACQRRQSREPVLFGILLFRDGSILLGIFKLLVEGYQCHHQNYYGSNETYENLFHKSPLSRLGRNNMRSVISEFDDGTA